MRLFKRFSWLLIALACIGMVLFFWWLSDANRRAIDELKAQGRDYVSYTPLAEKPEFLQEPASAYDIWKQQGHEGSEKDFLEWLRGDAGSSATYEQIVQAVEEYCKSHSCKGKDGKSVRGKPGENGEDAPAPSREQVLSAVVEYCSTHDCRGEDGQSITGPRGEPGRAPTEEEIAVAVANYCTARNDCQGPVGPQGEPTQLDCVIYVGEARQYLAWKYQSEDVSAYRALYTVPPQSECSDPVTSGVDL